MTRSWPLMLTLLGAAAPVAAEQYYLIVAGLGGQPRYQEQFDAQAETLASVARRTTAEQNVILLRGEGATRAALEESFEKLKSTTKPTDSLAVFLIGHGSYDGEVYKLNLPGPDIDGETLGRWLGEVPARSQLVVNATSASGAVFEAWQTEGRTVITATRSGAERNATRFAEHFARALADNAADINKNGIITAQEAFEYTARSVADSFTSQGTLATEHPQMAGDNAARFTVARLTPERTPATPEAVRLEAERAALEEEIEALRQRRGEMAEAEYLDALQALLVRLATVQAQIDEAGAEQP